MKRYWLGLALVLILLGVEPADSSCNDGYVYSYSNSRAVFIGGNPSCGYTGGTCMAYGCTSAGTHCTGDGVNEYCIDYPMP